MVTTLVRLFNFSALLLLYPAIMVCTTKIDFISTGLATVHPQPKDYKEFITAQLYDTSYKSSVPPVYPWPKL